MNVRPLLMLGCLAVSAGAGAVTYTPLSLVEDPLVWGIQGNLPAQACALSGNGLVTAFSSAASNLVPSDRNGVSDVFVQPGANLIRSSRRASGAEARETSEQPALSDTGRYVAFLSADDLLDSGDPVTRAAFWLDRQTQTLKVASRALSGIAALASQVTISGDGRYVVFDSVASNIVAGDLNLSPDVFRFDTQTDTTQLVSSTAAGVPGNSSSTTPSVDDSGNLIAFESTATNFVAGDSALKDVFVKDMTSGAIVRVSQSSTGVAGNFASAKGRIAANGNFVVFESASSNLDLALPKGTGITDIYRHTLSSAVTELVSIDLASAGANGPSSDASVSANGRYVWFKSRAQNLVAPPPATAGQLYRRDMSGSAVIAASNSPQEIFLPRSSDDGQSACFQTEGAVESADSNGHFDVYLVNVGNGVLVRQSVADSVIPSPYGARDTGLGDVSAALDRIVGTTRSRDLDAQRIANEIMPQVAEISPLTGQVRLLGSNGFDAVPDGPTYLVSLSANGQWAAIETFADNLTPSDSNGLLDAYRLNLLNGDLLVVSRDILGLATGSSGIKNESKAKISESGTRIVFRSTAANLVANDTNGVDDAFLWEQGNPVRRISVSSSGVEANDATESISMDANGQYIAFSSRATNMIAGDTNLKIDVFLHNTLNGQTLRVSRGMSGQQLDLDSSSPSVSADGRFVAYLVEPGGVGQAMYVYDRLLDSQVRLLPPANVSIVPDSLNFGRDQRYLSYVGALAGEEIAYRFDRFSIVPNFELARVGSDEYGTLYIAEVRLASATQAVLETNQPLAVNDRNRGSDLLLATLAPGAVSFPLASVSIPESAGTVDLPVRRLNGTEGFINVGSSAIPGSAGAADYALVEQNALWENGVGGIQNLRLQIVDDASIEGDETFTVQLQQPGGGTALGAPNTLQITITDNDATDLMFSNGFE